MHAAQLEDIGYLIVNRREYLYRQHDRALSEFHPSPRASSWQAQAHLPHHRTLRDLSSHRGYLHTLHPRRAVWCMGLDTVGIDLGIGLDRSCIENLESHASPHHLHGTLSTDGMVCRDRGRSALQPLTRIWLSMAGRRRHSLYSGYRILRRRLALALWPLHLALVRDTGYHLPLFCGVLVRRLSFTFALSDVFDNSALQ